jgi:hypothetical protein
MADIINYDPNTGRKLNPGESVVDKATGKTVTQGTEFGSTTSTVTSTPVSTTKTQPSGSIAPTTGTVNTGGTNGNIGLLNTSTEAIINYDPNTGRKLNPGESVVDNATGKTVTQGTAFGSTQETPATPATQTTTSTTASAPIVASSQIKNYLASMNYPSDPTTVATLAKQYGITNWTGSDNQSNALVWAMKNGASATQYPGYVQENAPTAPVTPVAPVVPATPATRPSDGFLGFVNGKVQTFSTEEAAQQAGATRIQPNFQYGLSTTPTTPTTSNYTGASIVDYLSSVGKASDYNSRAALAKQNGISNYTGTAAQNTQLLNLLKNPNYQPIDTNNASTLVSSPIPNTSNVTPTVSNSTSKVVTGQYQGQNIYSGSDIDVQNQMKAIDAQMSNSGAGTSVQASQSVTGASQTVVTPQDEAQKQADIAKVLTEIQNRVNAGTIDSSTLSPEIQNLIALGQQSGTVTGSTDADYYAKLLAENKAEMASIKNATTGSTGYQALIDMINQQSGLDTAGTLAKYQSQYNVQGISDQVSAQNQKVQALQADIGQLQASQASEVENARTRLSSMESISSDINEINYKYGLQIAKKTASMTAEAALAQVYQGNLEQANKMVDTAVSAYTADKKAEVDKFDNLYSVYGSWISDLNTEEKQILENAHQAAKDTLAAAEEDTTAVMKMMIDPDYAQAGISISDTLEQAIAKAAVWTANHPEVATTNLPNSYDEWSLAGGEAGTGYSYSDWLLQKQSTPQISTAQSSAATLGESLKGDDKKVSSDGYSQMYSLFKSQGGGTLQNFYAMFPMSVWMNQGEINSWNNFVSTNQLGGSSDPIDNFINGL